MTDVKKTMENIEDILSPLSKLSKAEFDEAIQTIAIIAIGTIFKTQGREYYEGFLSGAIDAPPMMFVTRDIHH